MASTRTKMLHIRLRPRQLAEWKVAAKSTDQTLSEWLREAGDTRAHNKGASK